MGLESVSEPDLDRDPDEVGDDEDGAFFSNSPSPAPPLTEDSSSLDIVTPHPLAARQPDPVHDLEDYEAPDGGLGDDNEDDEWVDPSPPPPLTHMTPNGLSVDLTPLKENINTNSNKGKANARKPNPSPSPTPPQHFPFPSSDDNEEVKIVGNGSRGPVAGVRDRDRGEMRPSPHIRSIRARNGGRTQSGGVKGVWKDDGDGDEF